MFLDSTTVDVVKWLSWETVDPSAATDATLSAQKSPVRGSTPRVCPFFGRPGVEKSLISLSPRLPFYCIIPEIIPRLVRGIV